MAVNKVCARPSFMAAVCSWRKWAENGGMNAKRGSAFGNSGNAISINQANLKMFSALASLLRLRTPFMSDNLTAIEKPPVTPKPEASPKHSSGDKRFKILEVHMKKHQFRHDALIEILHKAQELFGYLEDDLLLFISGKLKLPPSRVYGVATFYYFFTLKPQGEHTCVVCKGTACYVKGADKIISAIAEEYKIVPGETTKDNKISLLAARCIGACGIAPAVVYDGQVAAKQAPESALKKIKNWI
jgi:bidirectional [NiFe] hydrogenase diaphorase subunit